MEVTGSQSPEGRRDRTAGQAERAHLARQGATVFAGSMILGGCGFLFHAVASRRLGVETYGALYAAISLCAIAGIPGAVMQPVIARFAAEFQVLHDERHMAGMTQGVLAGFGVAGLIYVALSVVFSGFVSRFLHVPAWTVPFMGVIAAVVLLATGFRAMAQGTQDFMTFSGANAIEGFAKVGAIFVLGSLGLGGALIGFLAGPLLALIFLLAVFTRRYAAAEPDVVRYDWRRLAATIGGSAIGTATMSIIGFADVILVKHFFDAPQAGVYAAASLGGKMLLFVVGFIPTVLLPQAAHRHTRGQSTRLPLVAGLSGVVVFSLGGLAAFGLFGAQILHALVGREFDAAAPLLVPYGAAMALLALVNALVTFGIATHRLSFALPLLACNVVTIGAIAMIHPSLGAVVAVLLSGTVAMVLTVAVALYFDWKRTVPRVAIEVS